ncbi:MAG: quinol:cytochrome C oxidoreductase, partial [Bacteroidota bacterium]
MTTFDEKYTFTSKAKRNILIVLVVGVVLLAAGIFMNMADTDHADDHAMAVATEQLLASTDASASAAEEGHHETATWLKRLYTDLWINNMFFVGLGVIGVFFFAIQYASQSMWSTGMLRVSMAIGNWLPYAFVLIIGVFFIAQHDLFHWTHAYLYNEFLEDGVTRNSQYDPIIDGKKAYLNLPFYIGRMVVYMAGWYLFFLYMKKNALAEDLEGGVQRWK